MQLRPLKIEDIDHVVALADGLGLSHWSQSDYAAELKRPDSYMTVAVSEGEVVGFIVGRRVPGAGTSGGFDAEIYNIGVDRKAQRKGVGVKLLSGFLEKCRDESVEAVWLDVRENNDVARAFYERAGFEAFDVRRNFYTDPPDSGIVMQLAIAKDQIKFL